MADGSLRSFSDFSQMSPSWMNLPARRCVQAVSAAAAAASTLNALVARAAGRRRPPSPTFLWVPRGQAHAQFQGITSGARGRVAVSVLAALGTAAP